MLRSFYVTGSGTLARNSIGTARFELSLRHWPSGKLRQRSRGGADAGDGGLRRDWRAAQDKHNEYSLFALL